MITTADISAIISETGATAARMHRANLGAFWRWAAKAPRGWCQSSVLESLEVRRESKDDDIEILKPDDVKAAACRLAGLGRAEFQHWLGERGISQPLGVSDYREERENLGKWLKDA